MTNFSPSGGGVPAPARAGTDTPPIPETETPRKVIRLDSLTGLRFLAACSVFIYHSSLQAPFLKLFGDKEFSADYFKIAQPAGGLGVTFFFVLSGFVLTWSARRGDTAPAFWRRRFVKIYPNYVVAWVLAMILFASSITPAWKALLNLSMLHVWVPNFDTHFSVDPPGWSLGLEAVFYAAFPLLLMLFRRIKPQHLKFWTTGVIAGVIVTPALGYLLLPATPPIRVGPASEPQYYFTYVFPPVRLLDFALGILVALAVMAGRWRNVGLLWSGILLAASYVVAVNVPFLYGQRAASIIPIAMVIAAAAMADIRGARTWFSGRVMVWLGNISFAFYLLHFIVLRYVRTQLGTDLYSTPVAIAILLGDLAITVAASAVLYTLCERPLVRRFSSARRRRAAVAAESG